MPAQQKTGKGGARKIGRDKVRCALYRAKGTREKNKRRNILRYFREVVRKAMKHGRFLSRKAVGAMTRDDIGKSLLPVLKPVLVAE